ncbi:MAG: pitrilysin family protein [Bacteroidota bacterium]|nr:pitrilysin family protein [Bacteroidota bacterium]
MNKLNRKIQPRVKPMNKLSVLDAERITLDNGIPLYMISGGDQDVFKLDLVFNSGTADGPFPLVAIYTNKLLKEGTPRHTSAEISGMLDYYGAGIKTYADKDMSGIMLFSLNKYAQNLLNLFANLLEESSFPKEEFETLNNKQKQLFLVNERKVSHVARENFFSLIFGKNHPYGRITERSHFDEIEYNSIPRYYRDHYHINNCFAIVSGKISPELTNTINKSLGRVSRKGKQKPIEKKQAAVLQPEKEIILRGDVLQSAIRIGRPVFNKLHPDYVGLKFVSTLLGGYFGSRLMSNIREDKGYTYGIGSNLVSLGSSGYFFIATEVGAGVREKAIEEIYKEIARLQDETSGEDELSLVKNYMTGSFMQGIDGPFALAGNYKSVLLFGLDQQYFYKMIHEIQSITAARVQEIAQKYLKKEQLFELIVGK